MLINFTTGDFRIRVKGSPANYVYGSHMTLITRGSLGYASHQKGVIQGHLVHWYASWCSMIMFRTALSLDVGTHTVFLYHVRKIYLEGLFLMFRGVHATHWLLCQTDEINTIFQSFIYMGAQVNSSTIVDICWSKCLHYIMDYIINLGYMFFLVSLVWNLAYIDYSLCQIWIVYMQYLQYSDH